MIVVRFGLVSGGVGSSRKYSAEGLEESSIFSLVT